MKKFKVAKRVLASALVLTLVLSMMGGYITPVQAEKEKNTVSVNSVKYNYNDTNLQRAAGTESAGANPRADRTADELDSMITKVSVTDSNYTGVIGEVAQNQDIGIHLDFDINANKDFAHTVFTYDFSKVTVEKDGIEIKVQPLIFSAFDGDKTGVVYADSKEAGTYTLTKEGKLSIILNDDLHKDESVVLKAYFQFSCALNEKAFGEEGGNYTLVFAHNSEFPNPSVFVRPENVYKRSVIASKVAAEPNLNDGTVTYTITVKNTGNTPINDPITIHDSMTGDLSFKGMSSGTSEGVSTVAPQGAKDLDFTVGTLGANQTKTIKYVCQISKDALTGSWKSDWNNNTISAKITTPDGDHVITIGDNDRTTVSTNVTIDKDIVGKTKQENEDGTITWTITINDGENEYDIQGLQIRDLMSDTIEAGEKLPPTVTLQKYQDGGWVDYAKIDTEGQGFNYKFHAGAPITDKFQIVYTTEPKEFAGKVTFKNTVTATTKDGMITDTAEETVSKLNSILDKTALGHTFTDESDKKNSDVEVEWQVVVTLPKGTDKAVTIKDSFNSQNDHTDEYIKGSETIYIEDMDGGNPQEITGITPVYDHNPYYLPENHMTLTFPAGTFTTYTASSEKRLVVTYKTKGGMDGESKKTFSNSVMVKIGAQEQTDSAKEPVDIGERDYFKKEVAAVYPEKNMVTWKIALNEYPLDNAALKDVEFKDVITGMDFYGYYDGTEGTEGEKGIIYVRFKNYLNYYITPTVTHPTEKTTEINFTFSDADQKDVHDYNKCDLEPVGQNDNVQIYYTTVMPKEWMDNYNTTKQITNQATMTAKDITDTNNITDVSDTETATTDLEEQVITKKCGNTDEINYNKLTYTLNINPNGLQMCRSEYSRYQVVDKLPKDLIYINKSVKVVNTESGLPLNPGTGNNEYEFSVVDNQLTWMLPDNVPITITYQTYMLAASTVKDELYANSVIIPEPYVENESEEVDYSYRKVSTTSAGINGVEFIVEKIDANTLKGLEGAVFEVKQYRYDDTAKKWVFDKSFTGTTGENGFVSNSETDGSPAFMDGPNNAVFKYNYYYEITEVTAPNGYAKSNKVYKVLVEDIFNAKLSDDARDKLKEKGVNIVLGGIRYLFTDVPQNYLELHKKYYSADGLTQRDTLTGSDAAEIKVYDGEYTLATCRAGIDDDRLLVKTQQTTLSYTEEKSSTDTKGNIYRFSNIAAGKYTVYESKAAAGYQSLDRVYHFTVEDDGTIKWENGAASDRVTAEIKNYEKVNSSVTLTKSYKDWNGDPIADEQTGGLEKAVFYIQKTTDATGNAVTEAKKVIAATGNTYTVNSLSPGTYKITEADSEIYKDTDTIDIVINIDANGKITYTGSDGRITVTDSSNNSNALKLGVVNQMKNPVNKITLEKIYIDGSGTKVTDDDVLTGLIDPTKTKFTLSKKDGAVYNKVTDEDKQISLSLSDGKVTASVNNLDPGSYKIEETTVPAGYFKAADIFFTVNTDYTITYDGTTLTEQELTVTNQGYTGDACRVKIIKNYKDHNGKVLSLTDGATKFLYSENLDALKIATVADETDIKEVNTSDSLTITGLGNSLADPDPTFYFKEIANISGYQNPQDIISIKLKYADSKWTLNGTEYYINNGTDYVKKTALPEGITVTEDAGSDGSITITWDNVAEKNTLQLTKIYYDTDGTTKINAGTLGSKQASFTLYYKNGSNWSTYNKQLQNKTNTSDVTGTYSFPELNEGIYRLTETVPDGYKSQDDLYFKVDAEYKITGFFKDEACDVSAGITIGPGSGDVVYKAEITNKKEGNSFTLAKVFQDYQDNTVIPASVPVFTIKGINGTTYTARDMTYSATDKTFSISNLPDGTYQIEETTVPAGWKKSGNIRLSVAGGKISAYYQGGTANDFRVTDGTQGKAVVTAELTNHPVNNQIRINKIYQDANGKNIDAATVSQKAVFELFRGATEEPVVNGIKVSGTVYTARNLDPGDYVIREKALTGYEADAKLPVKFTVGNDYKITVTALNDQTTGFTVTGNGTVDVGTLNIINKRKGNTFYLVKSYRDETGAVISNETAYTGLKNQTTFKAYFGDATETYTPVSWDDTDKRFKVSNLSPGTWHIRETAPDGYVSASGIRVVVANDGTISSVSYEGNTKDKMWQGATVAADKYSATAAIDNILKDNEIVLHKYYKDNGVTLDIATLTDLAKFRLYRDYATASEVDVTGQCLDESRKGEGIYRLYNIAHGDYTLIEMDLAGYKTNTAIKFKVATNKTISGISGADGQRQISDYEWDLSLNNEKQHNKIKLTKQYFDFADNLMNYANVASESRAEFKVYKVGTTETEMPGAVDTAEIAQGIYYIRDLLPGNYVIREVSAEGFRLISDIRLRVDNNWNIIFTNIPAGVTDDPSVGTDRDLTVANHALNGIRIEKSYFDTSGKAIAGNAVFHLKKIKAGVTFTAGTPLTDEVTEPARNSLNVAVDLAVDTTISGAAEKSYYVARDLPAGQYVITEESSVNYKTPYDGWYLYFEVGSDNKIKNVQSCKDDPETDPALVKYMVKADGIKYLDVAAGETESLMAQVAVNNYKLTDDNSFEIDKSFLSIGDADFTSDTLLNQTGFALEPLNGGTAIPLTRDATSGKYFVTKLAKGDYILRETSAPADYELPVTLYLTVADNGKIKISSYTGDINACEIPSGASSTDDGILDCCLKLFNREKSGKIIITKMIKGDVTKQEADGALKFKVTNNDTKEVKSFTLKDFSYNPLTKKYTLELPRPLGGYTVEETVADINGYILAKVTTSVNGATATESRTATVDITNSGDEVTVDYEDTYEALGKLVITKTIKGDVTKEEAEGALKFTVTNNDTKEAKTYTLKDFKYNNATKKYTLELPLTPGGYTVEETITDINGHTLSRVTTSVDGSKATEGKTAAVKVRGKGDVVTVDYEDIYDEPGKLVITKTIKGDVTKEEAEDALKFKVTNQTTGESKVYTLKDFKYDSAKKKYTLTLDAVPGGYTVEETITDIKGHTLSSVKYSVNGGFKKKGQKTTAEVKSGKTTTVAYEDVYKKNETNTDQTKTDTGLEKKKETNTKTDTTKTSTSKVTSPKTGDSATLAVWIGLAAVGLLGMITVLILFIRRRRNSK